MRRFLFFVLFSFFLLPARSQDFNYTVSADSVAWNELNTQTILNAGDTAWKFAYKIPVGFSFHYLGRTFDSLMIETNGYLVFDNDRNYAFTAFQQFGDRVDSLGHHAVIGYELSGSTGNHVLKIQYKNAGLSLTDARAQSWQIWLKENGSVELHAGPTDYRLREVYYTVNDSTYTVSELDSAQVSRIGLLNQNMNSAVYGIFLSGSSSSPVAENSDEQHPETASLQGIPSQGMRYVFTPTNN
jgi:hypothetical protein